MIPAVQALSDCVLVLPLAAGWHASLGSLQHTSCNFSILQSLQLYWLPRVRCSNIQVQGVST